MVVITTTFDMSTCPCCGSEVTFPCGSCGYCSDVSQPYEVDVTVTGIANNGCAFCTDLNTTWRTVLDNNSYFCHFGKDIDPIGCLPAYNNLTLTIGSTDLQVLITAPGGSGTANMAATWAGGNNCTTIGSASGWAPTSPNPTSPCDFTSLAVTSVSVVSYVSLPGALTASLTSSCPGLNGLSIPLTYNSTSLRWEGSYDFGDGEQLVTFTCADEVDAVGYNFAIVGTDCSGNTATFSTLSYHPFSWGPFSMTNPGCDPSGCTAGSYTLEVTVTE